ncbi:MAG: right-handed parallel beta-helix repeat-containing protein [Chloracidobacterium sp.]|nr:right-handed parallel beta-helix repeat-containing protein [Chloracidobacterium sp.]
MSLSAQVIDVQCVGNAAADTNKLTNSVASSKDGDLIRIHGACEVNQTIVLLGNRTYEGNSRTGSVIRQADNANLSAVVASDSWANDTPTTGNPIRIAHLEINGNKATNSGTHGLLIRSWLTVIEDVQIQNAPGDGILLTNKTRNGVTLTNTQVNGRISNVFVTGSGGIGIHVSDSGNSLTDWDLLDSWIADSGQSGIYLENAAGWKVVGNHIYGVRQHALYANRCYGTTVADNYIEDFGRDGGAGSAWYGIGCTVQGDVGSVIRDNKVFNGNSQPATGTFRFIGIPRVNYGTGVVNVTGNVVRGVNQAADNTALYYNGGSNPLRVTSTGNQVYSAGTPMTVGSNALLVGGI